MKRDPESLWSAIEAEMATFETGSNGFYALPSGHPITDKSAAKKFARVLRWADEAHQKLLTRSVRSGRSGSVGQR